MATENEMTIPEMDELTAEELAAADPTGLATLLYVIRGLGADRDRSMNLAEFAKFIGSIFSALKVYTAEGQKTVNIENGAISGYNNINRFNFVLSWLGFNIYGDGFTLKADDTNGLNFSTSDASFTAKSSYFEYAKGEDSIYFDADGFKVTKGDVSVSVTESGMVVKSGNVEVFKIDDGVMTTNVASIANGNLNKIKAGDVIYNELYIDANTAGSGWDLAENWSVGQVKRFYGYIEDGSHSLTVYNELGEAYAVSFSTADKNTYQEFLCVGFVNVNGVSRAALRVHK